MPFKIVRNDITKMKVDAIVNTASPEPGYGRGTDSAIYERAGAGRLLAQRKKIGRIEEGEAEITSAFSLDAKYIIHTAGPVWQGGGCGEAAKVRSCYEKSLKLALKHGCRSIAFPLISTGAYGYPKQEALEIAVSVVGKFLAEAEMTVYLVVFDGESFALSGSLFAGVDAYIDEHYVEDKLAEEYGDVEPQAGFSRPVLRGRRLSSDVQPGAGSLDLGSDTSGGAAGAVPGPAVPQSLPEQTATGQSLRGPAGALPNLSEPMAAQQSLRGPAAAPQKQPEPAAAKRRDMEAAPPRAARRSARDMFPAPMAYTASSEKEVRSGRLPAFLRGRGQDRKTDRSLEDVVAQLGETFQQRLLRLIDERGMTDVEVYKRANLDRKLFSKIRCNVHYRPKKMTAIALAVALCLNLDETKDLLARAELALSPSSRFDLIIEYFIDREVYDIYTINLALFEHGEPLLGEP